MICLSGISEACTARPCSHHNFDFLCLASWLQLKTTCPLCKAEVSEIQYDFTNGGKSWKTFKVPKIGLERTGTGTDAPITSAPTTHRRATRRSRYDGSEYRGLIPRSQPLPDSSSPDSRARGALVRRRHIYRNRLYSLHVGTSPTSRYRDISPHLFNTDTELLSRARAWVRRELEVFEFLSDESESRSHDRDASSETGRRRRQNNAEFVLEYVIAILKTVDIQGSSGHAEELLSDFLGRENCKIFLHELRNYLRSPYSIEAWDRHVQYDEARASPRPREVRTIDEGRDPSRPENFNRPMGDRYRPSNQRSRQRWTQSRPSRGSSRRTDIWRPGDIQDG